MAVVNDDMTVAHLFRTYFTCALYLIPQVRRKYEYETHTALFVV